MAERDIDGCIKALDEGLRNIRDAKDDKQLDAAGEIILEAGLSLLGLFLKDVNHLAVALESIAEAKSREFLRD